jgi:transformation/transcription domain-associated protein
MEILANSLDHFGADDQLRDTCADALTELYAELSEDDLFYGLWRRRCLHDETNAALALEQNGLWPRAQELYELAQSKARAGTIPYTENEYSLWQDHWILAAQKLQQWDILTDLARHEGNHDLLLECAWRLSDWGSADREMIERTLNAVSDVATPRRKVFEAYTALIKAHTGQEKPADFLRVLDEAIQLAIRKWVSLPKQLSSAHIPLLQLFQQYVELQEAASVFESLTLTNVQNLEARVTQDLKPIFQTWRERLPNFWDDISVWSDLLAWRQHVFSAVTKVYVPLIPQNETATYGYRGYHETAWTINRFGHVARKHQLSDVCTSALGKIYALPNIEISEAFLKLREQAMCHYQKPDKFAEGLESISTTNLMYFAPAQKAEFLTLKGMFIAKLGQTEDANLAFAQAVQMDLNLPKAWAEWGRFNDRLFRDRPAVPAPQPEPEPGQAPMPDAQWNHKWAQERISYAANAVSCYLQAAGLYKNAKARKLLIRVLWLLSLDDASGAISRSFEAYQGDMAIWYWITLIPQLLLSLSHREARHARSILMKIAKIFPQVRTAHAIFGSCNLH